MSALKLVEQQAEDEGLWSRAATAFEAYVQKALRELHAAVEQEAALKAPGPDAGEHERRLREFMDMLGADVPVRLDIAWALNELARLRADNAKLTAAYDERAAAGLGEP